MTGVIEKLADHVSLIVVQAWRFWAILNRHGMRKKDNIIRLIIFPNLLPIIQEPINFLNSMITIVKKRCKIPYDFIRGENIITKASLICVRKTGNDCITHNRKFSRWLDMLSSVRLILCPIFDILLSRK
jgi:hypothetical protein